MEDGKQLRVLDLIREGRFPILGNYPTREVVRTCLGAPSDHGIGKQRFLLWRYGSVEFHFDREGTLLLIHMDNFESLSPSVDTWVIDSRPSQEQLSKALLDEDIEFSELGDGGLRTESGVEFTFRDTGELHGVSLRLNKDMHSRKQITVRLTEGEYEKVKARAQKSGISMSQLLTDLIQDALHNW